jgi:hypothetical protein
MSGRIENNERYKREKSKSRKKQGKNMEKSRSCRSRVMTSFALISKLERTQYGEICSPCG